MLQYLHVKNLALIDEIEVEFGRGLNILTGETGAGKSIILGSVNLALGGRYTKDILRQGTRYGLVELTFSVESERQIRRLKELDVYPEDGFVTLQRRLMEGRSVSKINGETVPVSMVRKAGTLLIDIHGQHENQSLLHIRKHLELLDDFAGEKLTLAKENYKTCYQEYGELKKELGSITQKVLTSNLRMLEENGILVRHVYAQIPPRVDYTLTSLGYNLKPVIDSMVAWAMEYRGSIVQEFNDIKEKGKAKIEDKKQFLTKRLTLSVFFSRPALASSLQLRRSCRTSCPIMRVLTFPAQPSAIPLLSPCALPLVPNSSVPRA